MSGKKRALEKKGQHADSSPISDSDKGSLILELNQRIFQLERMLQEKSPSTAELQKRLLDAGSIIIRLKSELSNLKDENSALKLRIEDLEHNLDAARSVIEGQKNLAERISEVEKRLSEADSLIQKLRDEKNAAEGNAAILTTRLSEAESAVHMLKLENVNLKKQLSSALQDKNKNARDEEILQLLEKRSSEVLQLKSQLLKEMEEKESLKKKLADSDTKTSYLQQTVTMLTESLKNRDSVENALNSQLLEVKGQLAERDRLLNGLKNHLEERNKVEQQLISEIESLKKTIEEKNSTISELLDTNHKLVEMNQSTEQLARGKSHELELALKQIDSMKAEIERLASLLRRQEEKHGRELSEMKTSFELQKQMLMEESAEKEERLRSRVGELEALLSDMKRTIELRNSEIAALARALGEQSGTLAKLSRMPREIKEKVEEASSYSLKQEAKSASGQPVRPAKHVPLKRAELNNERVPPPPEFVLGTEEQRGSSEEKIQEVIAAFEMAASRGEPQDVTKKSLLAAGYSSEEVDLALLRMGTK